MAITNGFDETQVLSVMTPRKGWRQPTASGSPVLDSTNLTCKSGKYFQDHHPAVTIDAIKSTQADFSISDSDFNAFLTSLNKSVCMELLTSVFNKPMVVDQPQMNCCKEECSQIIEQTSAGKFVGLRIKVAEGPFGKRKCNAAAQLHSLALLFNGVATFNIYCFHDLKKAPLWTKEVTTVANSQTIVLLDEKVLRPSDANTKGGVFYLGYYQEDLLDADSLPVKALDYSGRDWEEFNLVGCEGIETTADKTNTDFNRQTPAVTDLTYGLTVEISTYYDYTTTIINRIADFDELIGNMMAKKVIEYSMFNARSNKEQRIAMENNQMLYTDLNQAQPTEESPFAPGLRVNIRKGIEKLQQTFFPKQGIIVTTPC